MDLRRFNDLIGDCLHRMISKYNDLGLERGVAVVYVPDHDYIKYIAPNGRKIWRPADPERGVDDNGANYLAVAMGKIMQSVRTGEPSCPENAIKGESPWRGCVISNDGNIFFAFSGGTQDEDVAVSISGKGLYDVGDW